MTAPAGQPPLTLGGRTIADAPDRVRRYAGLPWSGGPPEVWAFGYYDAIPTAHDSVVTPTDVVCAASLHSGLRRSDLEFFTRRRDELAGWLDAVPADHELWEADDRMLAHLDALADFEPDVTLTLLTKVLHRKRPLFVPLLDRHVIDWYRQPGDARKVNEAWPLLIRRIKADLDVAETRLQLDVYIAGITTTGHDRVSILRFVDVAIWMEGR